VVLSNGVDLSREERLKKCDVIIDYYEKILIANTIQAILSKQKNDDVKNNFLIHNFSYIK
jgi:hypothetical protein